MKLSPLIFACGALCAQTLQVLPSPAAADGTGEFRVMFAGRPGWPVAAVQWRIVPPDGITIVADAIQPGTAAKAAGKQLACASAKDPRPAGGVVCVVAGGIAALPNGPIAVAPFRALPGAQSIVIRVDAIAGATPDGQPVRFADASGALSIGRRPIKK